MSRLLAWLRFRGWRNRYWREDSWSAECHHNYEWPYTDEDGFSFCVSCGALLSVLDKTDSQNTTTTIEIVV